MSGIDSEAARHKARRDAASGLAGAQDAGRPPGAKPATAAKGGQAGSGQLGGEAARHRAHRASLMGLPLKQQAATQVKSSGNILVWHNGLGIHCLSFSPHLTGKQSVSPGCPYCSQTSFFESYKLSCSNHQASMRL